MTDWDSGWQFEIDKWENKLGLSLIEIFFDTINIIC